MQKQVITILPDGEVSGLQVKKGKGVDLRTIGGEAHIERVSIIEWDADRQAWYIDVLQEVGQGVLTVFKWQEAFTPTAERMLLGEDVRDLLREGHDKLVALAPSGVVATPTDPVLFFTEYDEAVAVEVEYLNMLRLRGQF